jgi:hypothetical protein
VHISGELKPSKNHQHFAARGICALAYASNDARLREVFNNYGIKTDLSGLNGGKR